MKKFAFAIACTFVFTPALAAEKAVAKKEPIKMTSSEMEKVVAGAGLGRWHGILKGQDGK